MTAETASPDLPTERILDLLRTGDIEVEGLIPWSSNATLLVTVTDNDRSSLAVYKPQRGERPLWDFPLGSLGKREAATYLVDGALGWAFVPPTVMRTGPYGLGSVQLFIHAQEDVHYFTIADDDSFVPDLMQLAALDALTNNADRKAGHCLVDDRGRLWAIDNALTFHAEPKLRTVIWAFAGEPVPQPIVADLVRLRGQLQASSPLSQALASLLDEGEVRAFGDRLRALILHGRFPEPGPGRPIPWPPI